MFGLNKNLFISEVTIQYKVSEDITCLINDALIKTYLLERERGNSGRNRTIKMIISYKTKTPKHRETEGEGKEKRERERERENLSGYSLITAVAFYSFALVKSRSET